MATQRTTPDDSALGAGDLPSWRDRPPGDRASILVFAAALTGGFFAIAFKLGSYYWFNGDEWIFLAHRDAGSLLGLLEPHNEHLVAVPLLVYRLIFHFWGLSDYTPYQVPVILAHLLVVLCLWLLMRRSGVNGWIATAAASVFILYGPGEENIVWAFQLGFTGSLALGLGQLCLADHRGGIRPRDFLGLALGFVGLFSSGFTPVITVVVGAVVLVRRGLDPAIFHTVPLGIIYLTWWFLIGPNVIEDPYGRSADFAQVLWFVWTGVSATFVGLAGSPVIAVAYAVVLVVGLMLAYSPMSPDEALDRAVLPVGLLFAGLVFLAVSGYGRWWINASAGGQSRYVHLVSAFTLPALAVALDALARRWKPSAYIVALLMVSVIPGNIRAFESHPYFGAKYFERQKQMVVSLAESPLAEKVPPYTRPDPLRINVTIGWLLERRREGTLPDVAPKRNPIDPLLFGLSQLQEANPYTRCEVIYSPIDFSLRRGDELGVETGPWTRPKPGWYANQSFTVQLLREGRPIGRPVMRHPGTGALLRVEVDELEFRLGLAGETESIRLCRPGPDNP